MNPLILPYAGIRPRFAAPPQCGAGAAVLGRVTLGPGAKLGALSVIRADGHYAEIGRDFVLGPRSTLHIAHDLYPTIVGDCVAVGENACVHACTLGNDVIVEDRAVILDGAIVEDEVILEPSTYVFPRARLPRGHVYAGAPAKPVRAVTAGEIAARRARLFGEQSGADRPAWQESRTQLDASAFIASTVRLRGTLRMAANSSIWFSCDLDAGDAVVSIGTDSNVQDNTRVRCSGGLGITIGRGTTVGHNVLLHGCTIGDAALIGIGSVVAAATVVQDHVFLAAGATTEPGQVLESGWLYGRSPARKIAPLDQAKRDMIGIIISTYCDYARDYKAAELNVNPVA